MLEQVTEHQQNEHARYRVGDLIVDTGTHTVARDGQPLDLPHLSYDLLLALVRAAPNFLSHDELMDQVWGDVVVSPETLTQRVKLVRDALGDDPHEPRYIGLVRGEGYRLIAAVSTLAPPEARPLRRRPVLRVGIGLLCLAVLVVVIDRFVLKREDTAATAIADQNSIAVLPFVDMSAKQDQGYFSDGISEELLNLLAQIPELRVIARSSSFSFKGQNVDIATVAKQLNVAHVVEGSVRKMGNRVRITAQLIEARSDSHLWSQSYDRELDDIFAVQEEIAAAISEALKVELALVAGTAVQPTVIKAANTDAYDAYLRGRELIHLRGGKNLQDAIRHLERALRLDERFAPAHAQLAIASFLSQDRDYGTLSLEKMRRKAILHLDRAQALEPNLAEAHGGRALLALDGDLESAVEHARKALALNPSYSDAMIWLYIALRWLGRYEEGDASLMQLLVTDPLNILGRATYSRWLSFTGRVEEAHEIANQLLVQGLYSGYLMHAETSYMWEGKIADGLSWDLGARAEDPGDTNKLADRVWGFISVGEYAEARRASDVLTYLVDVAEGQFDKAIQATQRRMQLEPDNDAVIAAAAHVLYAAGRIDEALPLYERFLDFRPAGRPIPDAFMTGFSSNEMTMRLALARRKAGDEDGAQAAAQIARQDHAARRAAGRKNHYEHRAEAMLAAFQNNPQGVIAALKSAIQLGMRNLQVFDDPIFEDLWDEPRFVALQQELDAILAAEHDKVLQLICFNNPVPDDWQPLPETCEGVEE